MARPDQEAIDTFMSITGASEPVAIQKLEEHAGNLNEAVDAHFSEGDRNITHETSVAVTQDDLMDIDDPIEVESHRPPFSLLPFARNMNPFSLFDRNLIPSIFDSGTDLRSAVPFVSHPREVREIPIEVKDGNEHSGHSGPSPTIQDVTGTAHEHGPEIQGTVTIDEEDDEDIPTAQVAPRNELNDNILGGYSHITHSGPSAPGLDDLSDYGNDIEEEMIRAAIEASKRDAEIGYPDQSDPMPQQRQSHLEDEELAHAVSLSLKTAEQEKAVRELEVKVGPSESEASMSAEVEYLRKLASSNGRQSRLEVGSSSAQDVTEDIEEQPLWGGISSLEHDEAVMLEGALFAGVPQGSAYRVPYVPHQFMQNGLDGNIGPYPQRMPRPPSPSLSSQRLIREQQDDEYLASLQADQEKEFKVREEAETRLLEEQAAREAALEEERQKEEESRTKLAEEQEMERQLAAKEASLPHEPSSDDENAVTLLVRMPDGSRRGRRFLKSHKLQYLFDFIDVGRVVKPGTYRLDMITAGMDTTAISVEWGMAELIKNPRVQEKAQEELDRVIGYERVLTESDFLNLPYLQSVAKEALRLHPPTPLMLPHRANANVKVGGYDIPKGSNVHVNVWAVARDPAMWKSPLEFRPERFLEEDVDMKGHDFRLLPFGAGRRVCPGAQLGINLVTSMLGHLLHHYSWAPPNGLGPEEIDMVESPGLVTYMRTPLQAVPKPRLPRELYKRVAVDVDVDV